MPTIFDIKKFDKDPLDLIVRHKDIVRHLRGNRIDGLKIRDMLNNWHGLKIEFPISVTKRDKQKQKQIDYAMRYVKALVSNEVITDKEREFLCEMYNRLWCDLPHWEKGKSGGPVYKMLQGQGEGDAISFKQMIGRQVATINKYIQPFNKMYLQMDIFDLISELLEVWQGLKCTQKQIANLDKNNLKFL
jgi:hypothetical protein